MSIKIRNAVTFFTSLIIEEGPEDQAAWEHRAHLESALEAKTESDGMAIIEDAVGTEVNWEVFNI